MTNAQPVRLFISHSHADNAFGVRLAEDLRRALGDEQSVWYDVSGGLHGGDAWWRKIVQEIAARPLFLVVLSPDAMESRWVNDEIDLAWNLKNTPEGKTIIPVLYRECQPRADLRTRHIISFLPPRAYETALAETLAALGARVAPESLAAQSQGVTSGAVSAPARSAPDIIEQFTPQIAAAYVGGDWPDVTRKAEFLMRRAPERVPAAVHRMLGIALLEEGATQRARDALDVALALDPLDMDALRGAARAALALGEPMTAHTLLDDALALASDSALRLQLLEDDAFALNLADMHAEEVRRCDEALRLAQNDLGWRARRLMALTRAGRASDAQAEMEHLARDGAVHKEAWSLRQELMRESRAYAGAGSDSERNVIAERFAALLTQNAVADSVRDETLSLRRHVAPRLPETLAALGYVMRPFGSFEAILPPLCEVTAGPSLLSDGIGWTPDVAARDLPHQWVNLAAYQIARFPVTVAEYACFTRATRREPLRWVNGGQRLDWQMQLERPDHPVVCVTWYDALAYAAWLSAITRQRWRLPTEAEWEKAARWDALAQKSLAYPWGDTFNPAYCNCASAKGQTTPVGDYATVGASPCGASGMAGNVWEWTSNLAADNADEAPPDAEPTEIAMLRGGSWVSAPGEVSGVARRAHVPNGYSPAIGFRLICAPGR